MSQSKISAFFRPPRGCKRNASQISSTTDESNCPGQTSSEDKTDQTVGSAELQTKSRKLQKDECVDQTSTDCKTELIDSDQIRIEQNKQSAKLKLWSNKTNGLVRGIGPSWLAALEPEFSKEYFLKLSQFVAAERKQGTVYPPPEDVFTWTRACAIKSVKVVIIGQDPYHGPNQAHGLCFSVLPGIKPPPSLDNIYKELESDIVGFKTPGHGNLIGWAQQGVLLLNACLTVKAGQPNSHAGKGWEKLTDSVISWLNTNLTGLVFLLWGAYAQKKGANINKKKHHILTAVHPSPLSAHRGFFGCKHFSQCNTLLAADGQVPIDWTSLPEQGKLQ